MNIPESDREVFYKHMGHSALINAKIYQAPPAEAEIFKVGSRLRQMHGCIPNRTATIWQPTNATLNMPKEYLSPPLLSIEIIEGPSSMNDESSKKVRKNEQGYAFIKNNIFSKHEIIRKILNNTNSFIWLRPCSPKCRFKMFCYKLLYLIMILERSYTRWRSDENALVNSHFKKYLIGDRLPSKLTFFLSFKQYIDNTL